MNLLSTLFFQGLSRKIFLSFTVHCTFLCQIKHPSYQPSFRSYRFIWWIHVHHSPDAVVFSAQYLPKPTSSRLPFFVFGFASTLFFLVFPVKKLSIFNSATSSLSQWHCFYANQHCSIVGVLDAFPFAIKRYAVRCCSPKPSFIPPS